MKVRILLPGRTETHPDEYAARLFEQGRAVPTEEPAAPEQAQGEAPEEERTDAPKAKKKR